MTRNNKLYEELIELHEHETARMEVAKYLATEGEGWNEIPSGIFLIGDAEHDFPSRTNRLYFTHNGFSIRQDKIGSLPYICDSSCTRNFHNFEIVEGKLISLERGLLDHFPTADPTEIRETIEEEIQTAISDNNRSLRGRYYFCW